MGPDEEPASVQPLHVVVGYGPQPQLLQPLHLDAVVHDVAQRVDPLAPGQRLLGPGDGPHDAEAESRMFVDLDLHGSKGCRSDQIRAVTSA